MKTIWIISDSEPIPEITGKGRLMRAGKYCYYASSNKINTIWWSSTWLHYERRFLEKRDVEYKLNDGTLLKLINVKKAYDKHVSLDRILYCKRLEKKI